MRVGIANLPLHTGTCPKWLFERMEKLAGIISTIIIDEYGDKEYIRRLSDPYFFQALGCVLGFDWHSSGLTTTVCGALKESVNKLDVGIKIAGGKGNTSRKAPDEIQKFSKNFSLSTQKTESLIYSSKMAAKVDNALIHDGYNLYHHTFIFTEKGGWAVIQQGMSSHYARRYHWLSDNLAGFVEEPHSAICCDKRHEDVLDMTAKESKEARETSLDLVNDSPKHLEKHIMQPLQKTISDFVDFNTQKTEEFTMPPRHIIIDMNKKNIETLKRAYEIQPGTYEELVAIKGIGPKTIRSLALISELVYGKKPSWRDPVRYSFAHGGKDGIPYPVNKKLMDDNILLLKDAIKHSRLGNKGKMYAIKRLKDFYKL